MSTQRSSASNSAIASADTQLAVEDRRITRSKRALRDALVELIEERGLAMDLDDIRFCRDYFRTEQRPRGS